MVCLVLELDVIFHKVREYPGSRNATAVVRAGHPAQDARVIEVAFTGSLVRLPLLEGEPLPIRQASY